MRPRRRSRCGYRRRTCRLRCGAWLPSTALSRCSAVLQFLARNNEGLRGAAARLCHAVLQPLSFAEQLARARKQSVTLQESVKERKEKVRAVGAARIRFVRPITGRMRGENPN